MKKLFVMLAALGGLLLSTAPALADGPANPANIPSHQGKPLHRLLFKQPLPAFQAAPWYLYWPYNSHFLMPAPPLDEQFGAPGWGGGYVNPYFPTPYGPAPRKW